MVPQLVLSRERWDWQSVLVERGTCEIQETHDIHQGCWFGLTAVAVLVSATADVALVVVVSVLMVIIVVLSVAGSCMFWTLRLPVVATTTTTTTTAGS